MEEILPRGRELYVKREVKYCQKKGGGSRLLRGRDRWKNLPGGKGNLA